MLNFNGRIKDCLGDLQKDHPNVKAVVMGTRKTDPYSGESNKKLYCNKYRFI